MSKYRRFSITRDQAQVVTLALANLKDELERIIQYESNEPYWHLQLERATQLKLDLDTYRWERN